MEGEDYSENLNFPLESPIGCDSSRRSTKHKGILSEVICKRCGGLESVDHVLLLCEYAQRV